MTCPECGADVYVHKPSQTWGCENVRCATTGKIDPNRNENTVSEIFRIVVQPEAAVFMNHSVLRGAWEAAVIERGGTPVAGGVTVRRMPGGRTVVTGRAERKAE